MSAHAWVITAVAAAWTAALIALWRYDGEPRNRDEDAGETGQDPDEGEPLLAA